MSDQSDKDGDASPRIAIIGCKSATRYLYRELAKSMRIDALVTISPEMAQKHRVAGYDDLSDLAAGLESHVAHRYALTAEVDFAFFERHRFDVVFVAGWQRLIPDRILQTFARGAFGMHGSAQNLPFGRGRSPMNWSLIEGRRWFFTNLFRYLPGADDGPVIDTACFSINQSDDAETLHFKNLLAMVDLVRKNAAAISDGSARMQPQPSVEPTYYPKREPEDGIIDWEADIFQIERFIRAVAPPFDGAYSFIGEARCVIERAALFYTDLEGHPFQTEPVGTVCAVLPNGKFCIRGVGGVLLVHSARVEGEAKVEPGLQFHSPDALIRRFPRNRHGHFDLPTKPG